MNDQQQQQHNNDDTTNNVTSVNNNMNDIKSMGRESRFNFRNYAESQLRQRLREIAFEKCDNELHDFDVCSKNAGIMVIFTCRTLYRNVHRCMEKYNGEDAWTKYKEQHKDDIERLAKGFGGGRGVDDVPKK